MNSATTKKLFRHHRYTLAESLATTITVEGLADLRQVLQEYWDTMSPGFISNIRIKNDRMPDDRLPREWNGASYYVLADMADGYKGQCIGMCNFYEE